MNNIAILMAQSEYKNAPRLDACKNDLMLVSSVIEKSGKYNDVLILDDSVEYASDAKDRIIKFVEKYKGKNAVDEVFLYFSGHGNYEGGEFYYVWNDFEPARKRQTSLLNSDLDAFLKNLNANLTVKVVDACQSGIFYLKGIDDFSKMLKTTTGSFKKCYFMFSSQNDESSSADSHMSFFTKSILRSLCSVDTGKGVRYKDVINFVSDEFEVFKRQTPFFVAQGDFTEKFIDLSTEVKNVCASPLIKHSSTAKVMETVAASSLNLLDLVKQDAQKYVSYDEAKNLLEMLKKKFTEEKIDSSLENLYSIEVRDVVDYCCIPRIKEIAKWVQSNGSGTYSKIETVSVPYEEMVPKNSLSAILRNPLWDSEENYKKVTKYRDDVSGFKNTIELPFVGLEILCKGLYPNLMNTSLFVIPVLSRIKVYFFVAVLNYKRSGWDEQVADPMSAKWGCKEIEFDECQFDELEKKLFEKLMKIIVNDVNSKFSINEN